MTFNCSHKGCDFTTDSKVGLGVHKSRSHNLNKFVDVNCEYCGNEFEKRRSEVNRTDTHFCSRNCHFSWKSETDTGESEILDCDYCDGETRVYPKELERYKDHFCSSECKNNHFSENYVGKDSPNWKGGVRGQSYGSNWLAKRKKALERDGLCCQVCDMTRNKHYEKYGKDLEVHHKIPIAEFDEPEEANYLINLVTTCRSCHGQLDTISRREADRKPTISV
jgi:5-methylcytosine-specific restriction endonuclease McrA